MGSICLTRLEFKHYHQSPNESTGINSYRGGGSVGEGGEEEATIECHLHTNILKEYAVIIFNTPITNSLK